MHYTLEKLTHQKLHELFPGTPNWCGITIKGKHHTYAELRAQVLKEQDRKGTSNLRKSNHIEEMKRVLEMEFPKADVFINKTQPNVHINGCKCYIICTSAATYRLGIMHKETSFDDMQTIAEMQGVPSASKRHILFNYIDQETLIKLIKLLCH